MVECTEEGVRCIWVLGDPRRLVLRLRGNPRGTTGTMPDGTWLFN